MKYLIILFCALLLTACNFPLNGNLTPTPNITQAYATIQAQILTRQPQTTSSALGTAIPAAGQVSSTPFSTQVMDIPLSSTQVIPTVVCDRIQPGIPLDVTIPDDTIIPPGESLIKTWRLVNSGNCAWTTDYAITWFSGALFSSARTYQLERVVPPGSSVDISVEMTAPITPGTYQSNWKLQNGSDWQFGIGPTGNSPFWVRIIVPSVTTPTVTPTFTATAMPSILASGTIQIMDGSGVILASRTIGDAQTADLLLQNSQIIALNNTRLSVSMGGMPDYTTCLNISRNEVVIQIVPDNKFKYFCFRDNTGHIGWIQILSDDSFQLDIELLTWTN